MGLSVKFNAITLWASLFKMVADTKIVYITTKDIEQAKHIGKVLVEERLAACVNILPQMTSIYYWQDELQTDEEAILIAKTRASLVDELIKKVKDLHSYDVPAIIVFPIESGNSEYLNWLVLQTS